MTLKVKLIAHTPNPEEVVAQAAKLCYSHVGVDGIMEKLTPEKIEKFVDHLATIGHESPLEHVNFTFAIEGISRVTTHQLVRHRLASYSQQSQRYVKLDQFEYIIPPEIERNEEAKKIFIESMNKCQEDYDKLVEILFAKHYQELLDKGVSEKKAKSQAEKMSIEDARYVFPNACETKIVCTMNARSLLHFFNVRCCCYDDKTEVLTNNGWKLFKDIKDDDVFYSLNLETQESELSKKINSFVYDFDGEMVSIKSQSIDQLITPNHKMLVSYSYDNKKWILDEAEEYKNHKVILMKKNCKPIKGKRLDCFILPEFIRERKNQYNTWLEKIDEKKVDIHDFMKFLGMYLSDGYAIKAGEHYNVGISKGNEIIIDKYKEILSRLSNNSVRKFKDKRSNCWKVEVHDRRLFEFLKPLGKTKEKRIPKWIWEYDYSILENLFEGFKDGDMNKTGTTFTTISKDMADDFQRLLLHLGYSGTLTEYDRRGEKHMIGERLIESKNIDYYVSVNRNKNEPIIKNSNRNAFENEYYNGKIYCVELEKNNILYIRRNGKTCWSGNSRAQWEIRAMADEMLKECKKVAPTLFKKAGPDCTFGKCGEGSMSCGNPRKPEDFVGKMHEWCPECDTENEFPLESKPHKCKKCGKELKPCSICYEDNTECNKCKFEK